MYYLLNLYTLDFANTKFSFDLKVDQVRLLKAFISLMFDILLVVAGISSKLRVDRKANYADQIDFLNSRCGSF